MLEPPMFRPPGPALVRVEQEDSLGEVGAGGVVAMALLNTVLMLATLATLGRSANFIIIAYIFYPPILFISIIDFCKRSLELRWFILSTIYAGCPGTTGAGCGLPGSRPTTACAPRSICWTPTPSHTSGTDSA